MCIFHWVKYGCGFEDLRTDIEQSLCDTFVKLSDLAPTFLCPDKKRTYLYEPFRCSRCRVCEVEDVSVASCATIQSGGQRQNAKVCRRHPVVVGRWTFMGDTCVPSEPGHCEVCARQAKDMEEDDRLRHIAKAVYRIGAEDDSKAWESYCRVIAQDLREVSEGSVDLLRLQPPRAERGQSSIPYMPLQRANSKLDLVPGALDSIFAVSKPRLWKGDRPLLAQELNDKVITQGLRKRRIGREALSYGAPQVRRPKVDQDKFGKTTPKVPPNNFVLSIASSKLLIRRKKERQRRYVAEAMDGEMGATLRRRGLYTKEVDAWIRMALEEQDISDERLKVVVDSFTRKIRVVSWVFGVVAGREVGIR